MRTKLLKSRTGIRMMLVCMMALPLTFSACDKSSDSDPDTSSLTVQEAATVMTQAVDPQSGGLTLQTEISANLALNNNNALLCGIKKDSTITGQLAGPNRSFNFSLNYSRMLTCNTNIPSVYTHTFTGTGSYSAPEMSSTGTVAGSFTLTGLGSSSSQLSLDQTYTYTGTQQSKVGQQRTLVSNVTVQSTGVKVDKTTRQIVSGTAVITVTGTVSTGGTFNYTGTLTYLGSKKASLAVNGGSTTTITW